MAKKAKAKAKLEKVIQKVLDSSELDEKLIAEYNKAEASGLIDKIKCYIKCYGGYLLAAGAGCIFGVSLLWGAIILACSGCWAYKTTCACKPCKGGNVGSCCNG